MKNKLMLFSCIFVLLLSSTVFAAEGMYVSGNIGLALQNEIDLTSAGTTVTIDFDTGLVLNGAVGVAAAEQVRVELEVAYRSNEIDTFEALGVTISGDGDYTSLSGLVNLFYDIKTESAITPYIGGGVGFAKVEIDDVSVAGISIPGSEDDTVFAYQLGVGIGYSINDNMTVDFGYRYFATADPNFGGEDIEYGSHDFTVGIRFGL